MYSGRNGIQYLFQDALQDSFRDALQDIKFNAMHVLPI